MSGSSYHTQGGGGGGGAGLDKTKYSKLPFQYLSFKYFYVNSSNHRINLKSKPSHKLTIFPQINCITVPPIVQKNNRLVTYKPAKKISRLQLNLTITVVTTTANIKTMFWPCKQIEVFIM